MEFSSLFFSVSFLPMPFDIYIFSGSVATIIGDPTCGEKCKSYLEKAVVFSFELSRGLMSANFLLNIFAAASIVISQ